MKKLLYLPGMLLTIIVFLMASCQQQPSSSESVGDMTEIKNNMKEVSDLIEESIEEESVHLFINKTDFALNELDNQISEYLSRMDYNNDKVEKEPRNKIIKIKQKVAGIDLRLALLDNENLIGESPFDELPETTHKTDRVRPPAYPYPYPYRMTTPADQTADIDDTAVKDMEEYSKEIHKEIVNELKELKSEVDEFVVEGL
jgi:hypothetical protein